MTIQRLPVLVLHVNNRCNCRCTMCSIWKSSDTAELTPQLLHRYLPDMKTLQVESVALTGGEPLMNSHLAELCSILKDAGIRTTILTTGLLLPRFAGMLVRLTSEVIVSLDGPPAIHDRVRRTAGAFDLLAAGVRALRDIDPGFPVSGRCTVQKLNCTSLRDTADAARSIGLRSISFLAADLDSTAFNRPAALSTIEAEPVTLTAAEIANLELEIGTLDLSDGFIVETREKLLRIPKHFRARLGLANAIAQRCNAPWVSAVVETDGTLRPCFFHEPVGQARQAGLLGALNGQAAIDFRDRLRIDENETCRRCVCSLWRPAVAAN
jgi:MoaA/NifB/PqqE/SkfB family radical SAM enzyme